MLAVMKKCNIMMLHLQKKGFISFIVNHRKYSKKHFPKKYNMLNNHYHHL